MFNESPIQIIEGRVKELEFTVRGHAEANIDARKQIDSALKEIDRRIERLEIGAGLCMLIAIVLLVARCMS